VRRSAIMAGIAVGVLLGNCRSCFALNPSLDISQYAHTAWTVQDDALKGAIRAIAQTPDGYLWLGTEFGLVRFDGIRFVTWNLLTGQRLPSNIRSQLAGRDGTLWIGTVEGLANWKDGGLHEFGELTHQNVLPCWRTAKAGYGWEHSRFPTQNSARSSMDRLIATATTGVSANGCGRFTKIARGVSGPARKRGYGGGSLVLRRATQCHTPLRHSRP